MINLLNQDRDGMYTYTPQSCLYIAPSITDGTIYGFNLYIDGDFLGTFDSIQECIDEINAIINCKQEYYCVTGFSDWDIVERLMLEE